MSIIVKIKYAQCAMRVYTFQTEHATGREWGKGAMAGH